tara:strand:+ start:4880 stop:5200 length:321 start_codon:yes stop_codon:yes gene_type:complete
MTDTPQKNLYIPKELVDIIFSYNPEHRENMTHVLDELLYVTNYTTCDNENCEAELYKHEDDCVTTWVVGNEHHFCNEECASYGEWSIRYDIRKSRRNERRRLTLSN